MPNRTGGSGVALAFHVQTAARGAAGEQRAEQLSCNAPKTHVHREKIAEGHDDENCGKLIPVLLNAGAASSSSAPLEPDDEASAHRRCRAGSSDARKKDQCAEREAAACETKRQQNHM